MIEIITPESQQHWLSLRTMDITSTEVAALFGISPYSTMFETWHRKKEAIVVKLEENERMKWGTRLQDAIATGIAEDQGWKVRRMDEYIRDPDLRLGASFDFSIEQWFANAAEGPESSKGLLEIKNVDAMIFKDGWLFDDEGSLEAPPHIELQVQQQLLLTGRSAAYIGALVGGNKIELIERRPDESVFKAITYKVKKFWESIEANQPPAPDFEKDAEFISSLYQFADPGKIMDARGDDDFAKLAMAHRDLGEQIKELDSQRSGVKARMLTRMNDVEKVVGDGYSISAGMVAAAQVSFERKPYRMFKPTWKKEKFRVE